MAVDVAPASHLFVAAGMDPATIPTNFDIPSGPSWHRLIRWLLGLGENLPAAAIPDVVDLYTAWSLGMLGLDPLTPSLLPWLYGWLIEIETARDVEDFSNRRKPFGGEVDADKVGALESDLRSGFLLFCNRSPGLAGEYLRSLRQRRHSENIVRGVFKFRGALAQAAPAELAELTAATLIPQQPPDERRRRRTPEEPFDYVDHEFLPASPAQGPFLELLTHGPQHGLGLIRRLVDHAIGFYSGGRDHGSDAFVIPFPDGARAFPWVRSYGWSRDGGGPTVWSQV